MNDRTPYEEQETIINIPAPQISKTAEVYSCVPSMVNKLRKQAETRPDCVKITKDLGNACFADVDSSCIKIIPKRIISDEYRAAAAERLAKVRAKR